MSWITVIWSAAGGACLLMALMHLLVWFRDRRSWADLCFFVMVLGVLGLLAAELVMMYTESPLVYGSALRWVHLVNGFGVLGSLGFVHFYFGTSRRLLLWAAIGARVLIMVVNFASDVNLQLRSIESLRTIEFLGEPVSILGAWETNPWFVLGPIATLVQVAYIINAAVRLGRANRDMQRRALIVGGALVAFYLGGSTVAGLVAAGAVRAPLIVSLPFVVMVLAMSYELSGETLLAVSLGRAVRERDVDLSLAADSARLGFWSRDLTNDEVRATDTFRAMFGFTSTEQLDVDAVRQRLHPDDRDRMHRVIEKAAKVGGDYEAEYRVVLPDGRIRWLASRGRFELGRDATPVSVRGVTVDITERRRSEEALRESEERFRNLANHAPVMLWMAGIDKRCTFFNKGWLDFTGRTFEQELRAGWSDGIHPDDLERALLLYASSFDARQAFTIQYRVRRRDGQYCWLLDTGVPRFASGGEFLGFVGSALDITPLKQAQELVQASEEKFRVAVEGSPIAIVMLDPRGVIRLVNVQAETVFGYPRAELIGQPFEVLVPDAVRARLTGPGEGFVTDWTKQAVGVGRELLGRRKDGSDVPVEMGLNPIRSREGMVVMASIVDITERLQATKEVVRQRRELSRLSRVAVLGELTASLAHEINQPLTAIMANAQTASRLYTQGRGTIEEFRAIMDDIVADTTRARDVIRQVRRMVKEDEGEVRRVQVVHVVEQVLRFLRSDAVAHGVFVAVEAPDALPPAQGKEVQVQQVLVNLLLNAFDAMESVPRHERRADITVFLREDGKIEVAVRDTGNGIPAEKLEQIFDPFFTTKPEGMGMGLSVSRTIIAELGGEIGANNNPRRGASVWFRLPVAE